MITLVPRGNCKTRSMTLVVPKGSSPETQHGAIKIVGIFKIEPMHLETDVNGKVRLVCDSSGELPVPIKAYRVY